VDNFWTTTFILWTEVVQDKSYFPVDNFIHCFEQPGPGVFKHFTHFKLELNHSKCKFSSLFYLIETLLLFYLKWMPVKIEFMVFNATFNNISVIPWWSLLLVKETRVLGENHRPVTSHWQTLSHNVVSSTPCHERGSNSQL
jgi:hypothetical protein